MSYAGGPDPALPGNEHAVQLFDTPETLAQSVAAYIADGLHRKQAVLAMVTMAHWSLIAEQLTRGGTQLGAALRAGALTVRDADALLDACTLNNAPQPERFHRIVGGLVSRLARESPTGLRVYGEMVDRLAYRGDLRGARRLEELWNGLLAFHSLTIFCGYSAEHFGDARSTPVLREICRAHTAVKQHPEDRLGSWLIATAVG